MTITLSFTIFNDAIKFEKQRRRRKKMLIADLL